MNNIVKRLFAKQCARPGMEHLEVQVTADLTGATAVAVDGEGSDLGSFDEDVGAAERITQVVNAVSDAQNTTVLADEAQDVTEGLESLIAAIQGLNRNGGMPLPAFALAQQASERYASRLNIDIPLIGAAMESFGADGAKMATVSTAGLESVLNQLQASAPALAKQSQRTMDEMIVALRKAIPDVAEKLQQFRGDLELSNKDPQGSISVDQGTHSALAVDGTVPEDLVTYFAGYSQLGNMLFHEYSRVAQKSAEQTAGLVGKLNFDNPEGFWQTLDVATGAIDDPRKLIPMDQLTLGLPGAGPLFEGPCTDLPTSQDVFSRLSEFVKSHAPIIQADVGDLSPGTEAEEVLPPDVDAGTDGAPPADPVPPVEGADPALAPEPGAVDGAPAVDDTASGTTIKALNRQQLRTIAEGLKSLLCDEGVEKSLTSIAASWGPSEAALHEAREALNSMTGAVPEALGARTQIVARYIETLHRLAIWPQVNFVANLIYTVNAFVALGTQILHGEAVSDQPVEAEVAAEEVEANTDVAVDTATDEVSVATADEATVEDSTLTPEVAEAAIDGQADAVAVGAADEMGTPVEDAEATAADAGADAGGDPTADLGGDPAGDPAGDPNADPLDPAAADGGTGEVPPAGDEGDGGTPPAGDEPEGGGTGEEEEESEDDLEADLNTTV